jgi:hypothetical protein
MNRNNVPDSFIKNSMLAKALINLEDTSIFSQDINENYHFNSNFHNDVDLIKALEELKENDAVSGLVEAEYIEYLAVFEEVFNHKAFTGRSGTFYGYEGLGSIYWHMVSKLLLATQETIVHAMAHGESTGITGQLVEHYYEIRAGIGINKSPDLYGAFPTDAYSHTPGNAGAKQPGLTGQVKEDVISRLGELGMIIKNGMITFTTSLMNYEELLSKQVEYSFFNLSEIQQSIILQKDQIGYTFCQVPVVYLLGESEGIRVFFSNGSVKQIRGNAIDREYSNLIFKRSGEISNIEYTIKQ